MRKTKRQHRWLSLTLCLCLLVSVFPLTGMTYAAEQGCNHQHDETCGYVEAVEGQPCTFHHEHDDACGYAEAQAASPCMVEAEHIHDAACGGDPDTGESCNFKHEHDDACGYAEGKEATPCSVEAAHIHDETCGYVEAVAGAPCTHHVHDENCGGLTAASFGLSGLGDSGNPDIIASGNCGGNDNEDFMQWKLNKNGVLTISGYGAMGNYYYTGDHQPPWKDYRSQITSVVIENNVAQIGMYAFGDCTRLKSVTFPNSLRAISNNAFYECTSLETVTFPSGLETIYGVAFFRCTNLKTVIFPNSLKNIYDRAFSGCRNLNAVTFLGGTAPTIDTNVFTDVSAAGTIYYYAGSNFYTDTWKNSLGLSGWTLAAAPIISAQPADQKKIVGGNAQFSVTAKGAPAPSYQWQESTNGGASWADVTGGGMYFGAATDTLTLTGVQLTHNGYQYRCVVSNSVQTAKSDAATLTVTETPVLNAAPDNLAFGEVPVGTTSASQRVTVSGEHLSETIAYIIEGQDREAFHVSQSNLTAAGGTLDVTFTPTAVKDYTAELIVFAIGDSAAPVTVRLTGKGISAYNPDDVAAINAIINSSSLGSQGWTVGDPGSWNTTDFSKPYLKWDNSTQKRITELNISNCNLSGKLDVSQLTSLERLNCAVNKLDGLNLTGLTSLKYLSCTYNNLSGTLDATSLISLQELYCFRNTLDKLDVTGLTSLQYLDCNSNKLSKKLDVSGLTNLKALNCSVNKLDELNLTGLKRLEILYCFRNTLDKLDVTGLTSLQYLDCSSNNLSGTLDVTGLTSLQYLDCNSNNLSGKLDVTGLRNLQNLYCYSNNLSGKLDVAGLTSLQTLKCSNNKLSGTLDVTGLTSLAILECFNNKLSGTLDVTGLHNLQYLNCSYNNLSGTLDVTGLRNLQYLNCSSNLFRSLKLSGGDELTVDVSPKNSGSVMFRHSGNLLENKSVTLTATPGYGYTFTGWTGDASGSDSNPSLTLEGNKSVTATFTVKPNADYDPRDVAVINGIIESNGLTWTKNDPGSWNTTVGSGPYLTWSGSTEKRITRLFIPDIGLSGTLDVTGLTSLQYLDCYSNSLDDLNVTGLTSLQYLHCSGSSLNGLDVTSLTGLQELYCVNNNLTELKVSSLSNLQTLDCSSNGLNGLDLTGLDSLKALYCDSNPIQSLKLPGGEALTVAVSPANSGTVMFSHGQNLLTNKTVTLTATANAGYKFKEWTGGAGGSDAENPLTLDGNKSVTANFQVDPAATILTVKFNDNGSGGNSLTDNEMKTAVEAALGAWDKTIIITIRLTGSATEITGYNWKYLLNLYKSGGDWTGLTSMDLSGMSNLTKVESDRGGYGLGPRLTTVHFPANLTTIGSHAFCGCTGLTGVDLPDNLTHIGESAFQRCTGLTGEQLLPDSLRVVDDYAFYKCMGLTAFSVTEQNPYLSSQDGVLYNKNKSQLILCPGGKTGVLTLPESVTAIRDYAASDCTDLTGVNFPTGLRDIGEYAFFKCTGLSGKLVLPANLLHIQDAVFYGCTSLTGVDLPANLQTIGVSAFYECTSLRDVKFPASLQTIKQNAFYGCSGVNYLTFLGNTPPNIIGYAFVSVASTGTIFYPSGAGSSYTESWKNGITGLSNWTLTPGYRLTVSGGSDQTGPGLYLEGASVQIKADAAPSGKTFDKWTTSNGGSFADANSADTTFTMPANDVTVTATYHTHKYEGDWQHDDTHHWQLCSCGEAGPKAPHSGGTANCHEKAICEVCNAAYGNLNPNNHDGGTELRNAKDATEEAEGYTGDTYCLGCGEMLIEGAVIPKLDHKYEGDWQHDDTHHWKLCSCGEAGPKTPHSGGTANCHAKAVCEVCEAAYGSLNPDNHDGGTELRNAKDATEEAEGYTGDTFCLGCGEILAKGTVVPKLEPGHTHKYEGDWQHDDTDHWQLCSCGEAGPKTPHSGGTANCHAKAVCEVCKAAYGSRNPNNHDGGTELRNAKAATEEAEGYTGDTYCLGCSELIAKGKAIPQTTIPQTGDDTVLWPWLALMLAGLIGCGGLLFTEKRRRKIH